MVPQKKPRLKAIDFFCGAGGMTCGMKQAGIDVIAGIDIESECKETYEKNNQAKFIESDLNIFFEDDLLNEVHIKKNDDSMVFIGCSPCQYYTKLHTNKSKSKIGKNLLSRFQYFVDYFKPGYIAIENVPGLYLKREKKVLKNFKKFLVNNSYSFDDGIIDAYYYGVPQHRERYLLIATRLSAEINLPERKTDEKLTVYSFIGEHNGFKKIPAGYKDPSDFIHSSANLSEKNLCRVKITNKDGGSRFCWKDNPELQINAYRGKDDIFRNVYGRMWWHRPAPTITTRFNSLSNGRFGHPEEDRAISLREGATLQTFSRDYVFVGPTEYSITCQIGNAVPPELAKRIGNRITTHYDSLFTNNS